MLAIKYIDEDITIYISSIEAYTLLKPNVSTRIPQESFEEALATAPKDPARVKVKSSILTDDPYTL